MTVNWGMYAMKVAPLLKTLLSIAIGGAAGAASEFLVNAHGHTAQVDWHQLGINAAVGAIVALCHYLAPSPASKA